MIQGILARAAGKKGPSLAEVPSFQAVMKRCARGRRQGRCRRFAGTSSRWATWRSCAPCASETQPAPQGTNVAEFFKEQGFDAVQGIGGFVDFAVEPYEVVHRTADVRPGQVRAVDEDLELSQRPKPGDPKPEEDQFKPQPWVPAEIASYATFQFDVLNAFDNLDPLVDDLFGRARKGCGRRSSCGLEKDPQRTEDRSPQGADRPLGEPGDAS